MGQSRGMCGRYASTRKRQELLEEFEIGQDETPEELQPDYNVAPTKQVYAVLARAHERREGAVDAAGSAGRGGEKAVRGEEAAGRSGGKATEPVRQLRVVSWGLVPSWAKDLSIGSRMINARVETLAEKPAFRKAFARRRCLLPADGYYEWYRVDSDEGEDAKQPYFIHPDRWRGDGDGRAVRVLADPARADDDPLTWLVTCTIITTTARGLLGQIHDRMPMLIGRDRWAEWLDPARTEPGEVRALLAGDRPGGLAAYPVSSEVNSVRNNGPHLLEPQSPDEALF